MIREGYIEKIVYKSDETGYCVRQAMTTQNIPHSFQSVLTSHHESVADLTATVQSGQVRGKCFAVRVAERTALSKK